MNNIKEELQLYPHIADPKTKHDSRYDPNTYISIQTKVNTNDEFQKEYFAKLVFEGWVVLNNVEDIFIFPKGKQFKYRLNANSLSKVPEGTFRSGGWLIGKNIEDAEHNHEYILYKAYNGVIFSLQIKDLLEVYIKSHKRDISVFKKPAEITDYPVYLRNPITQVLDVIYYGKDAYAQRRFMNSNKYKKAEAMGLWTWSSVFNE